MILGSDYRAETPIVDTELKLMSIRDDGKVADTIELALNICGSRPNLERRVRRAKQKDKDDVFLSRGSRWKQDGIGWSDSSAEIIKLIKEPARVLAVV